MFWKKKKEKDNIQDPAVEYSKIVNSNCDRAGKPEKKYNKSWLNPSADDGCDQEFVYYEE